jgi:hypothetical protein
MIGHTVTTDTVPAGSAATCAPMVSGVAETAVFAPCWLVVVLGTPFPDRPFRRGITPVSAHVKPCVSISIDRHVLDPQVLHGCRAKSVLPVRTAAVVTTLHET